ncbi:hypothetical protein NE237_002378 [Protea cynaroides]|uniref:Uncharacterized protein n=1 Tax=Protea cynaroides TaxID=273540 RepID=A0A9Q0KUU5_9MAGN|nr:hypothetical protein NE237_002378 [Protea cynaroides]
MSLDGFKPPYLLRNPQVLYIFELKTHICAKNNKGEQLIGKKSGICCTNISKKIYDQKLSLLTSSFYSFCRRRKFQKINQRINTILQTANQVLNPETKGIRQKLEECNDFADLKPQDRKIGLRKTKIYVNKKGKRRKGYTKGIRNDSFQIPTKCHPSNI